MSSSSGPADPDARSGVRAAVRSVPAYPFVPTDAPIKLDQNENPYDFPKALKAEAARRMLERPWNRYPDLHGDTVRSALARYEQWDESGVVVTPGSNVLIKLLTELAGINQTVLTTNPTFSVYTLEASMLGAKLIEVPLNKDFSLALGALTAALESEQPGVFYLPQPHAPTGHSDSEADVEALVKVAERCGWVTVIDEAYYQYSGRDYKELVRRYPNTLSMRTFSKAWGLAGVRLGYILASRDIAQNVQKLVSAFNISALGQAAVEVALEHPEYMQRCVQEAVQERERMLTALKEHPTCQALPSQTNFFLFRTPDASAAYQHFLERGIVVRRQDKLHLLAGCLRVAVGTPAENDAFIAAAQALR